jgi:alkylation response protein AidB-like acyl-CoA dehydrogenase
VPSLNLIGEENKGFYQVLEFFDESRIEIAAQALGIAQGAFDRAIAYTKERSQFGKKLAQFQVTQHKLADMATQIEASRYLVYHAAYQKDLGGRFSKEAAMAKLLASQTAVESVIKAVQIHGGYGYTKEYTVERLFRDAKITEIYEGTSEVQRLVIAASLLR